MLASLIFCSRLYCASYASLNFQLAKGLTLTLYVYMYSMYPTVRSERNVRKLKYIVGKVLADFAVCDWWRFCKAVCYEKFSQIEGNGR